MIKKIFGLMIAVLLPFSLTGCNSGIKFNVAYDARGGFGYKDTDDGIVMGMLELADSAQELRDLCSEWNNPSFDENTESFSSEFSQKIRSYDEPYFNDNILIIYSFERGHSRETKITSINVDGDYLNINARYNDIRGAFTDEAFNWLIILEASKADIADATTVQIVHK